MTEATDRPVPELVELEEQPVAVVRDKVPMDRMAAFFDRAFGTVMVAIGAGGAQVAGPPLGIYHGMPTDVVDVSAGFPVRGEPAGEGVTVERLAACRAGQLLHVGSYDDLPAAYDTLMSWLAERGERPGPVMWEAYLTEPTPGGTEPMQTLVTWPVAG